MKHRCMNFLILITVTLFLLNSLCLVDSYCEINGIEYDDIVDVAFISYRNGEFIIEYTAEGSFRITVDTNLIKETFINAILGMKLGETEPYIAWNIDADVIEYYNTTIINIVFDSTPETSTQTPTETVDFFWVIIVLNFISIVILRRRKNS